MPVNFAEEYSRLEYQQQLKTIVNEVNLLLKTQYNLITFDLLPANQILKLLVDILGHFKLFTRTNQTQNNEQIYFMDIMTALNNVKYEPKEADPNKFREAIVKADRKTIYPILYWILTNKNLVEKRAYLHKFVKKFEFNTKLLSDTQFQELLKQYDFVINEFWKTYKENKQKHGNAKEAQELDNDITLIRKDITNISCRILEQKQKIKDVHMIDKVIEIAKSYQDEVNRSKKLEVQMNEAQAFVKTLEDTRKDLRQNVETKKMARLLNISPVEQMLKDLQINKLIFVNTLPKDLFYVKKCLGLCSVIANDPAPEEADLNNLQDKIQVISKEINKLNIINSCSNSEANLQLFKQQLESLSCKKTDLGNDVCLLKQRLVELDCSLTECVQKQHDIVGGEVFYGEKLSKYISSLREQSVTYKKLKALMNNVTRELNIAEKTLNVLVENDQSLEEQISTRLEIKRDVEFDSVEEIKEKCQSLLKEIDVQQTTHFQTQSQLYDLQTLTSAISRIYEKDKQAYNKVIGNLGEDIKKVTIEIEETQNLIKDKSEIKHKLSKEIKAKEDLYVKLSEEYINTVGEGESEFPSIIEELQTRVEELQEMKTKILEEEKKCNKNRLENDEQVEIFQKIINLITIK